MSHVTAPLDTAYWTRPEVAYPVLGPVAAAVARVLFSIQVRGLDRLPRDGPALVAANHVSHLDPLVLFSVLHRRGRRPRFIALEDLWAVPVVGWLLDHGRMIPVRRGSGAAPMVASACAALAAGEVVVIYPEGTLAPPGPGQPPPRAGAGSLALQAHCPVIPIAMRDVPPYRGGLPRPRQPVEVRVGHPVELDAVASLPDREARRAAAHAVLDAVRDLA